MGPQRDVDSLWPVAGPLLTRKINMGLAEKNWDGLLRLAGPIKFGHATASLIVGKPSASSRQNTLAAALKEYGTLRRTVYAARYLADETNRRKIARQLNKASPCTPCAAACCTRTWARSASGRFCPLIPA